MKEIISVTLIIPGTASSLRYERVSDLDLGDGQIAFTVRGTKVVSSLPYIVAYDKELEN